ncbi:MAG: DUF1524 domain-containing protein, partial [Okeania sp. SIO2D1]|nr:DUF1524 domain-containing protein [Okeania sp. SIO2D1]
RISTIALLACCLYQKIYIIKNELKFEDFDSEDLFKEIQEAADDFLGNLLELFSFDMKKGKPNYKPIIIRGSLDSWTIQGEVAEHYKSDISSYLANFIKTIDEISDSQGKDIKFPVPVKNSLIDKNIKSIQLYLDQVKNSFEGNDINYPSAWEIIEKLNTSLLSELWNYEYSQLFETVKQYKNIQPLNQNQKNICSLVQLFTFSSYLLKRCCLTVIKPVSQLRAFDMFQSLNATGTPLTAIETFKPLVVNIADSKTQGFKNSNLDKNFTKIENLMEKLRSASSKNKRTNEYLTLFSFTYEGKSLLKQFSTQRNWLIEKFDKDCSSNKGEQSLLKDKEKFIEQMGNIAEYCQQILYSQVNLKNGLPKLNLLDESERKLASFCLLYLKDANHKMAHTILSRFYSLIICTQNDSESLEEENQIQAQENFAISCKTVAAFFTLWRSALPTTGLDNVYRKLLQEKISWKKGNSEMTIENLKRHFKNALETQEIGTKEKWINKAINYLRYDNVQKVCRFVLFVTSHDTISDSEHPGLMKVGKPKSSFPYLEPSQWLSKDLKSIEHIAPQKPDLQTEANWDENLYTNDDYEQIGNLTLLPTKINSSAGNKKWIEKWIYYCHLAEKDTDKLAELKHQAEQHQVNLNDSTIKLLTEASCFDHIKPIIEIGATGKWDKNFVEDRTKRMCNILWKRMYEEWLS